MSYLDLSSGACYNLLFTKRDKYSCVVQVMKIEASKLADDFATRLLFLQVSDGQDYITATLRPHLLHLVDEGQIKEKTMIRIEDFTQIKTSAGRISVIIHAVQAVRQLEYFKGTPKPLQQMSTNRRFIRTTSHNAMEQFFDQVTIKNPAIKNVPFTYCTIEKAIGFQFPQPAPVPLPLPTHISIANVTLQSENFTIIARLTRKSPVTTYHRLTGSGDRQLLTLHDQTGEIGAVMWKAAMQRSDSMDVGCVYAFHNATVLPANAAYNSVGHLCQLNFNIAAQFEAIADEGVIPQYWFNYITVSQVADLSTHDYCDIRGIVKSVGDGVKFRPKAGFATDQATSFLDVCIVDESLAMVRICVWEDFRIMFEGQQGRAVSIKGLKWDYHQGPSLMTKSGRTVVHYDDDDPYHQALEEWYKSQTNTTWHSLSAMYTAAGHRPVDSTLPLEEISIADAKARNLGKGEGIDPFILIADIEVVAAKEIGYYACCDKECNKRADYADDGTWYCTSCDREFRNPRFIFNLSIQLDDGSQFEDGTPMTVTCTSFNEVGLELFGESATTLARLQHSEVDGDVDEFQQYLELVKGRYTVTVWANTSKNTLPNGHVFANENWIITRMIPINVA
ncbi:nucleic acid-binding protein [Calocera viscosa TUFC12733]|uniref:Nucleic acid-binding protein n=1 Tax=Calocera viscosa (strain TUFC12733) TaxID=1330018 RepID=A0A167QUC4_CALVF|nr:nucleic acid-binding protein [Calocera viscosa TUFC12733]